MESSESRVDVIRKRCVDGREHFSAYHRAIDEERNFALKQAHYKDDEGNTKDRRRIQPVHPALFHMLRHKTAEMGRSPFYFDVRPVDPVEDRVTADYAKWAIQHVIERPDGHFDEAMRRVVLSGLAGRMGVAKWTFDADDGPFGELHCESVDPTQITWTPGVLNPMSRRCPWLQEVQRVPISVVQSLRGERWKKSVVDKLRPDDGLEPLGVASRYDMRSGWTQNYSDDARPGVRRTSEPAVTLIWNWEHDRSKKKSEAKSRVIPEKDRYMVCLTCGTTEPEHPRDERGWLPEVGLPCPTCGTPLERIDRRDMEEEMRAFPDGRLTVCHPFSDDGILYDDAWPQRTRHWPFMIWQPYPHPFEPIGQSDTSIFWSLALIIDSMLRTGYEQMSTSVGFIVAPEDGLVDANGEPWQFTDENGRVAYYKDVITRDAVQFFQPQGVNPAFSTLYSILEGAFRSTMGISELGLKPDQSRDIAVGTVQALIETGRITVDEHLRTLRMTQSGFVSTLLDMIRDTWSLERWVRVRGLEGLEAMRRLSGAMIPNADIRVYTEPKIQNLRADEVNTLVQVAQLPPHLRRFVAEQLNLSQRALDELDKAPDAGGVMPPPPGGGQPQPPAAAMAGV